MNTFKSLLLLGLFSLFINITAFAQAPGTVKGQVYDSLGAVLPNATVTVVDATGKEKTATTNRQGEFTVTGLVPGKYIVRAIAPTFALYENPEVEVTAGQTQDLTIALSLQAIETQVDVDVSEQISTDPNNNPDATRLTAEQIKDLPDDPDELQAYLSALAGPGAGPDGAQFYIDGFTGGRMPPKESIREIRINSNPFSAEFERPGFGRVEILTKPGSDKFRGSAFFNFNDESLNSRNPFAINRAPTQRRNYGGFVSGPIIKNKMSFSLDVNKTENDTSSVVSARIINSAFNIVDFNQDFSVPTRSFSIGPRIDYQINSKNTLVARYRYSDRDAENQGIGNFTLPTLATATNSKSHNLQLTETFIINPKTVNETRFEFDKSRNETIGDNSIPTISVSSAFTGGGAQSGFNFNDTTEWELQNYTTTSLGKNLQHSVKFGVKVERVSLDTRSERGYGGAFTFTGIRYCLNVDGTPCRNADGSLVDQPIRLVDGTLVSQPIDSITQYREKLLGNTDPRFNPNQFTRTAGNPLADVAQTQVGFFVNDDWKLRPDMTISAGLRYENQTNISSNFNFAPRLAIAYAPGAAKGRAKTTIRGGLGIFYNRLNENNVLTTIRQDGVSQLQYIVTDNQGGILGQSTFTLNGVTNVPTAAQLAARTPQASTPYRIADDFQAPYTVQGVLGVDHALTNTTRVGFSYRVSRSLHQLRTRNTNAPFCPPGFTCPANDRAALQLLRPDPTQGNVYTFESSGVSNNNQFVFNFNTRFSQGITVFSNYSLTFAKSNNDGLPAYSYDLTNEYATESRIPRHTFFLGSQFSLPFGFRMSPTIIASSGPRFNITSGLDTNLDTAFAERPTFAALGARCQELGLTNSFCDIGGISNPSTTVVPKNYGKGPGSFLVNLSLNKTFGFGGGDKANATAGQGNQGGGGRGGRGGNRGGGMGGFGGPGGGGFFGGGDSKPYNITFGINVNNLFNTVNLGAPVGNLSSPFFGQSRSTGGGRFGFFGGGGGRGGGDASSSANRTVDLSVRFSF